MTESVKMILLDLKVDDDESLSESRDSSPYSKLKEKLRTRKCELKAFSLNFESVGSLGVYERQDCSNDCFSHPWDVRFSRKYNCIVISDYGNHRIQVFCANSKEYKTTLKFSTTIYSPASLYIEHDYDGYDREALFVEYEIDEARYISKYDLESFLINSMEQVETHELWKSTKCSCPAGIAVWKKTRSIHDRIVFVCDYDESVIYLFKSSTGEFISALTSDSPLFYIKHPLGIDISMEGLVFISQGLSQNNILILRYSYENGKWITLNKISNVNDLFSVPRGLVFDNVSKRLLVSICESNTIQVFTEDGAFCQMFGYNKKDKNGFLNPDGICVNELTGELYVCDYGNHRIQIYK
ncbi:hypothetical protein C9374_002788 [Naegleria lovaniensis]|uniref:Uncharacterized protein n=1 Tax=Naegleria lovaniensis TaxID=51637 RepID=A0AA88GSQ6_NAELO|nr:uncharacterized protein C9374_002788 [Naegleria lovaniensis]KAG2386342.1 hypothetical protein C9374_002788 [Naegleria lovaniensis]